MSVFERLSPYQPTALAILRVITALLFIEHGTQKLFGFPPAPFTITTLFFVAGAIELVGGVLILFGLFTRPIAFLLSGEMAIAYFLFSDFYETTYFGIMDFIGMILFNLLLSSAFCVAVLPSRELEGKRS